MKTYRAPWGELLKIVSAVMFILTVGSIWFSFISEQWIASGPLRLSGWLIPLVVIGALPFMVRGYGISESEIIIRRLFWDTRYPRDRLKSAVAMPDAMKASFRLLGNGGVFSFTGWYWKKSLGIFHSYVTDGKRTVVLQFPQRTIVVSPEFPEEFVNDLNS